METLRTRDTEIGERVELGDIKVCPWDFRSAVVGSRQSTVESLQAVLCRLLGLPLLRLDASWRSVVGSATKLVI